MIQVHNEEIIPFENKSMVKPAILEIISCAKEKVCLGAGTHDRHSFPSHRKPTLVRVYLDTAITSLKLPSRSTECGIGAIHGLKS
jgi:hypothetical protein